MNGVAESMIQAKQKTRTKESYLLQWVELKWSAVTVVEFKVTRKVIRDAKLESMMPTPMHLEIIEIEWKGKETRQWQSRKENSRKAWK